MARFGRDFAPWEQGRYHVASNGFVLASEHPKQIKCYPRIGKLSLPSENWIPEWATAQDVLPDVFVERTPQVDTYFEFMIVALREYETAARLHDELNK
jgi:hypothetical protein